jgi:POT family proton-dependent oligopeptide transporter
MSAPATTESEGAKVPLLTQLKAFSGIYWIANWMELVERFAYYGVRVVLPVFMVSAFEDGGPEFTHLQKGTIYAVWALVQSFVPIFTGGFADRYGYKINIAISTVLKIIGYLIMGYSIFLAETVGGGSLASLRPSGADLAYEFFFAGAMFLALGTAVFKPGLQGLIAHQMPKQYASLGWAMFYQMVNIGGFIGPLLAGYLRVLDWTYVFIACAIGIALNFIPLFFFKEPEHQNVDKSEGIDTVLINALRGLLEPRLFFFTISFAGFWLMFYQLFDILPNFIDDWIDTRMIATALGGWIGAGAVPTVNGGNLTQEWMINFNALLISFFAFAMGYLTGKVRSLNAIIIGIAVSAVAIYALGESMDGWWILAMIGLFSFGEMTASPTKMRYLASIAPPGKEGLYMGYVNFTVGIGWSIGSIIAGEMYQEGGDKIVLARRFLIDKGGQSAEMVNGLSRGEVLPFFEKVQSVDAWGLRETLWSTYEPYAMWSVFTWIGLGSMVAIMIYNKVTTAADADEGHSFNTKGHVYVRMALVPIALAFCWATWDKLFVQGKEFQDALAVSVQAVMFSLMAFVSFTRRRA